MSVGNISKPVITDPWQILREYTPARIALGRSGGSAPTQECLDFKLAHARARDAVNEAFEINQLAMEIESLGAKSICVCSQALDHTTYLKRPDLGRRLDSESETILRQQAGRYDLVVLVSGGLSALAAHRQTKPVLEPLLLKLGSDGWKLAPVVLVDFARVALQDPVGQLLNAKLALILLGERPGLGSPDSLGAYLVFEPRLGNTDANRNCVSNIRPEGLAPAAAADTLYYLLSQAKQKGISGIALKDDRSPDLVDDKRNQAKLD